MKSKQTTEDPELNERFNRVLGATVEALHNSQIKYAFIGGIASGGLGRPRSTHDIDIFVMPEDAERTLRALDAHGFKTEKTDPTWLYKGFKENILVDVIFKSKGEIYFDQEMSKKLITAEFHGRQLRLVAPEDLIIIKASAYSEVTPNHWHDAIALLSYPNLDWNYLIHRARRAPRRVLSLLLYAQSSDIWIPNAAIHELYTVIFGDQAHVQKKPQATLLSAATTNYFESVQPSKLHAVGGKGVYAVAHLRDHMAKDPRTHELDIQIEHSGENTILLHGEVTTAERKLLVETVAKELIPECRFENRIRILDLADSGPTEAVR